MCCFLLALAATKLPDVSVLDEEYEFRAPSADSPLKEVGDDSWDQSFDQTSPARRRRSHQQRLRRESTAPGSQAATVDWDDAIQPRDRARPRPPAWRDASLQFLDLKSQPPNDTRVAASFDGGVAGGSEWNVPGTMANRQQSSARAHLIDAANGTGIQGLNLTSQEARAVPAAQLPSDAGAGPRPAVERPCDRARGEWGEIPACARRRATGPAPARRHRSFVAMRSGAERWFEGERYIGAVEPWSTVARPLATTAPPPPPMPTDDAEWHRKGEPPPQILPWRVAWPSSKTALVASPSPVPRYPKVVPIASLKLAFSHRAPAPAQGWRPLLESGEWGATYAVALAGPVPHTNPSPIPQHPGGHL